MGKEKNKDIQIRFNNKPELIKNRQFFINSGLLLCFVLFKLNDLYFPYFWDEAWSYAPAIGAMIDTTPCLLPNCIEPDLYRGHPLLFYFLASLWGKIFGASLFSMHAFALSVSLVAAFSFYRLVRFLLGINWGFMAVALLLSQAVFIVQSSYVLPEMLVALFSLELFLAYLRNNKWAFMILGSLLLLTKESGFAILGAIYLFHFFRNIKAVQKIFKDLLWLLFPLLSITLFFIYQKMELGWFLYPLHTGMVDMTRESISVKTGIILRFLFLEQGRWMFWFILGGTIFLNELRKNRVLSIIALSAFLLGLIGRYKEIELLQFIIFLPIVILLIKSVLSDKKETLSIYMFCTIVFVAYVFFSAINFFMLRYLLCILPLVILLFLDIWKRLDLSGVNNVLIGIILIFGFIFANMENRQKTWIDDVTLNDRDMIRVHQKVVDYCEKNKWQDKKITTHFLMTFNLEQEIMGYLKNEPFRNVGIFNNESRRDAEPDIIIISAIEYYNYQFSDIRNNPEYELIKKFENHQAWAEIYVRDGD